MCRQFSLLYRKSVFWYIPLKFGTFLMGHPVNLFQRRRRVRIRHRRHLLEPGSRCRRRRRRRAGETRRSRPSRPRTAPVTSWSGPPPTCQTDRTSCWQAQTTPAAPTAALRTAPGPRKVRNPCPPERRSSLYLGRPISPPPVGRHQDLSHYSQLKPNLCCTSCHGQKAMF